MEKDNTKVNFIDENGISREGEILTIIEVGDYPNKYAVCSVPNSDETSDIFAYILNQDDNGEIVLSDIEDETEKNDVYELVQQLMV